MGALIIANRVFDAMATGYCYFCDAPAESDPCPTCGKAVHYPDEDAAKPEKAETYRAGKVEVETARPRTLGLALVIAAVVVVVIVVIGVLGWVGIT